MNASAAAPKLDACSALCAWADKPATKLRCQNNFCDELFIKQVARKCSDAPVVCPYAETKIGKTITIDLRYVVVSWRTTK